MNQSQSRENADGSRRLELPDILMPPTFDAGFSVRVDGQTIVACVPASTVREEDVVPMIVRSHKSTELALQVVRRALVALDRLLRRTSSFSWLPNATVRKDELTA